MTGPDIITPEQHRLIRADLSTVKEKAINIERHAIQLRMTDARHAGDETRMYRRLRDHHLRLERIEKRLSLREEP